jgi:hypothetical protein
MTDIERMRDIARLVAASGNRRLCPVDSLELAELLRQAAGEIEALRDGRTTAAETAFPRWSDD